ncbi:MAG: TfoX/Sxy family protein [Candidatus Gracilibacteria bacterium]|nr:TfoX/Sxy family protein [Candidatus Gracilibacteria bacterium]
MKKIPEFLTYFLEDCLGGEQSFSVKSMFSGYGIYKYGKIFAIYRMSELYFKVGKNNLEDYQKHNSKIFEYQRKGKAAHISYYTLPEEILENREELNIWINKSLEV